jgi:FAD:protein FMN transferase
MLRVLPAILTISLMARSATAEPELKRFSRAEPHMGVEFEAVLYAANAQQADEALAKAMARIAELDKRLSDYDLDSELSKLSETSLATPSSKPSFGRVPLSDDLWRVLTAAQAVSETSEGAFDVTIGPLTKLWRRARRWKELPDPDLLAAAKSAVSYQHLKLDPSDRTAQLHRPNMRLDLGGIAKGYAADEALKAIASCGIDRALVRASGDIAAGAPPPGETGWHVGVAPLEPHEEPTRFMSLAHAAVSTSGDAHQHLVVAGQRYSHIIDPRTGEPVAGRSSVTVVAPRGILADSLATAASVLGPDKAIQLIKGHPGTEALMVFEDEAGGQRTVETHGFGSIGEAHR